ncbi:hypothetical protein [Natrinema gelatinilyticum]|nr:hypothetical protein [Natrinema gelatinilyticum]
MAINRRVVRTEIASPQMLAAIVASGNWSSTTVALLMSREG